MKNKLNIIKGIGLALVSVFLIFCIVSLFFRNKEYGKKQLQEGQCYGAFDCSASELCSRQLGEDVGLCYVPKDLQIVSLTEVENIIKNNDIVWSSFVFDDITHFATTGSTYAYKGGIENLLKKYNRKPDRMDRRNMEF